MIVVNATQHFAKRTAFVYDDADQRTAIVDARTNRTTFVYDHAGRLQVEIDPLSRRLTHVYDKVGRLAARPTRSRAPTRHRAHFTARGDRQ